MVGCRRAWREHRTCMQRINENRSEDSCYLGFLQSNMITKYCGPLLPYIRDRERCLWKQRYKIVVAESKWSGNENYI